MRIALTHAYCWPEVRRGAERFIPSLGAALARRGHEVVHFTSARDPHRVATEGIETVCFRRLFDNDWRHEAYFGRLLAPALARRRFDAVHSLGRRDAVASVRAKRLRRDGRRTVMTDLGLPDAAWWDAQGKREARAARRAVEGIDVYSGMSRTAVEYLARNYGRLDGVVVPGGVDLSAFSPAERREPTPTILFSGAITERRKGVPVLLEALPLIAEAEPEVQLWLSGPGDPEAFLRELGPETRQRVKLLGLGGAEEQGERYGRAWITCLPSMHDSFGMALLESLACGTPIVTTTHGAPKELVNEGVTGELSTPDDPRSLADACRRGFELARREETVAACRASAEPYDWDLGLAPLCERLYAGG